MIFLPPFYGRRTSREKFSSSPSFAQNRKKGRNLSLTNEEAGNSDFHNVGADVLLLSALSAQSFFFGWTLLTWKFDVSARFPVLFRRIPSRQKLHSALQKMFMGGLTVSNDCFAFLAMKF